MNLAKKLGSDTLESAPLVMRPADHLVGRTLANDVLHRLRKDIIACTLLPGTRLRFETLRSVYGVSFTTLREALSTLASESLVAADGQRGFRVAPVSVGELMDLTDARVLIEREVLRRAIEQGDQSWRTSVLGAFHRMDRLPEQSSTSTDWAAAHAAFHAAMSLACGSPVLLEMRSKLFDRAQRYRRLAVIYRSAQRSNAGEHREIMEVALAGDSEHAADLIERHIRRTSEEVAAADSDLVTYIAERMAVGKEAGEKLRK